MDIQNSEKEIYKQKYGEMKDYIKSAASDKQKTKRTKDVIEYNNKNLIQYLEDRY